MKIANCFVADLCEWQLTQLMDADGAEAPLLQAALTFVSGVGPWMGSASRPGDEAADEDRPIAAGTLVVCSGRPVQPVLFGGRTRSDPPCGIVVDTLAREQFDHLLSLVERPNCTVQLDFQLSAQPLVADAAGIARAVLVNPRYWATTACEADACDAESMPQRLAARTPRFRSTNPLPRAQVAQAVVEAARSLTLQSPRNSDPDADHEQQEDTRRHLIAAVRAAMAEGATTLPHRQVIDGASKLPDLAFRSPQLEQQADLLGAARTCSMPPAATPPPSPTAAVNEAPRGEASPYSQVSSSAPGPDSDPLSAGVGVSTCAASARPEATDLTPDAPAVERLQRPAATVAAPGDGVAEGPLHTTAETEAQATPRPEVPEPLAEATKAPSPRATTAHAASPRRHAVQSAEATTAARRHAATAHGPLPPAGSAAKRVRRAQGVLIALLLIIASGGGYWFFNPGSAEADKPEPAARLPIRNVIVAPASMPPPASTAALQKAPDGSHAAAAAVTLDAAPTRQGADDPRLSAKSAVDAPASSASVAPAPATAAVDSKTPKQVAAARRAAPAPIEKTGRTDLKSARTSEARSGRRSAADRAGPPPPPPLTASVEATPTETTAPDPPPVLEVRAVTPVPAPPDPCSGRLGLKLAQCGSCQGIVGVRRYACEQAEIVKYCAGKWGQAPDCAWGTATGASGEQPIKP